MPTEQMHDAPLIDEIKAKAFGIAPRPLPLRPLGPRALLTRATPSGALGARGPKRPINAEHDHGTAPLVCGHFSNALFDLLTRRRDIQPCEPLGDLISERMHALSAHPHTG